MTRPTGGVVVRPTLWQENAARFATTRDDVDAMLATRRREGVRQVLDLLCETRPAGVERGARAGRAYYLLMRSYVDQVRIAGLGYAAIPGMPYEAGGDLPGVVRRRSGGRHAAGGASA